MTTHFREWTAESLQRLCDDQFQEAVDLEFKSAGLIDRKGIPEIAKAASGFANAIGGQIIFGVSEVKRCADHIDEGWSPQDSKAAWLDDVIRSNVNPPTEHAVVR